jgi:hypothetical protein
MDLIIKTVRGLQTRGFAVGLQIICCPVVWYFPMSRILYATPPFIAVRGAFNYLVIWYLHNSMSQLLSHLLFILDRCSPSLVLLFNY